MGGVMGKLYYGNGKCDIEGTGIRHIIIRYRGAILIDDKTTDKFAITAQSNGITIFPIKPGYGELKELFEYKGKFKIISIKINGNQSATIHRVMDYTELLTGNTESMTISTEDLKVTHIADGRVAKTELKQPYVKDLNTSDGSKYYFENGDSYVGYYHISLVDNSVMTGGDREDSSQLLYIKQIDGNLISTYNPTHTSPGLKLRRKQDRDRNRAANRKVRRGIR